jgi:hypothetical protein
MSHLNTSFFNVPHHMYNVIPTINNLWIIVEIINFLKEKVSQPQFEYFEILTFIIKYTKSSIC